MVVVLALSTVFVATAGPALAADPVAEYGQATVAPGESVQIQLSATDPDGDALTFETLPDEFGPTQGTVGPAGPSQCSAGTCTATVTYTADAGASGDDWFVFSAYDGQTRDYKQVDIFFACGSIISNGTVQLGVNCDGSLNTPNGPESSGTGTPGTGTTTVGLRYVPTNADGTGSSCDCEGWGVSDATAAGTGYVNPAQGTDNVSKQSFTSTATTATSVMRVPGRFEVRHAYAPAPGQPNLYQVTVSIKNISTASRTTRYRRVMDWEPEPTPAGEYATTRKGNAASLIATSNEGYASSDPRAPWTNRLGVTGSNWSDAGPGDQGALFDFNFGSLVPGATKAFKIYYGAAPDEATAMAALKAVKAEAYSLGQPTTPGGATLGTPNTFIFGFSGIGGVPPFPTAHDGAAGGAVDTEIPVTLAGHHPTGDALAFSVVSGPAHGTLGTVSAPTCAGSVAASCTATVAYTPDEGYVGDDSFAFRVSDGAGTDTATAFLTVGGTTTTTTYTGPTTVQYSDALSLKGTLRNSAAAPLASKLLTFRVGAQSTSATTNASGVATAAPLTVTQQPGAATQVHAEFLGGSGFQPSRQTKSFSITKEDCTVDYTGPAIAGPNGVVQLRAAIGEPDSRLGDRSGKPVRFTLTDLDGTTTTTTYDAVTSAAGVATRDLTIPGGLARDVYLVKASFAGDQYYKPCASSQEVLAVSDATAKATGGGWINGISYFGFNVLSAKSGQLEVAGPGSKLFHATSVTSLARTGTKAIWKGAGRLGTSGGQTYVATAEDKATSGVGHDTFKLVVRNKSGTTVYSVSGVLKGGNVKV
jgi:hypothetical protein